MKGDKKNIILERRRRKPKTPQKQNLTKVDGRDTFQTPNYATEMLVPFIPAKVNKIWEPACGQNKIVNKLREYGYSVIDTDLASDIPFNFLTNNMTFLAGLDAIITNPPFSLKRKFYERCREYKVPFALLIPADYSGWIIKAVQDGVEKIIPTRRIDYITPSNKQNSQAQFHSMWLTWGFGLGKSETFVELSMDMKKNI